MTFLQKMAGLWTTEKDKGNIFLWKMGDGPLLMNLVGKTKEFKKKKKQKKEGEKGLLLMHA